MATNLKPGDTVEGRFQNLAIPFRVRSVDQSGPNVWLEHKNGEIRVHKQDIKQYAKETFFCAGSQIPPLVGTHCICRGKAGRHRSNVRYDSYEMRGSPVIACSTSLIHATL